jgi:vacuolar-type H+-ATPase subunit H
MSFEQVGELVRLEKEAEQKLASAREEAAEIVKKAEENAQRLMKDAEEEDYGSFFKDRKLQIEEEKNKIQESTDQKIKKLTQLANKNKKKAILFITNSILGE